MNLSSALRPLPVALAAALAVLAPTLARAQLLDEVEWRREGADAVAQVRFVTPVRLGRTVSTPTGDLSQVYFDAPDLRDATVQPSQRQLPGGAGGKGLPTLSVSEEALAGSITQRKLVVRVSPALKLRVRAGRDNRSLELVAVGLGAQVRPAVPVAEVAQASAGGQAVIVMQGSTDPKLQMSAPVPKSLQDLAVSTVQRSVDGQTRYELHLGPFADPAEARRALELVKPRFPQATLLMLPGAAPAPAPTAAPGAAPGAPAESPDTLGPRLLAEARAANERGDSAGAIERLNRLLDLPPNRASREAQELVGLVRLNAGDTARARREFELFLQLYPTGVDSQRVATRLKALPAEAKAPVAEAKVAPAATTTVNGSAGLYYYGGQSQVRTEEFRDSPISGLPELVQNPTLSGTDQKLAVGTFDLNYRHRDPEQDLRFVVRDSYNADLMAGRPSRNKLSALYVDHKSFTRGTSVRLGRQSPTGGGVLGRFDGASAGYAVAPKWKLNAVAGVPTDKLQQTRRRFLGTSVDAEALGPNVSGSLYAIQQSIDGAVDRRAIGSDLRYFKGGTFVSGSLDYDTVLKAVNIASVQGTWQALDAEGNAGTTVNFLLDRRSQPILMLGNALFFQDPNGNAVPVRLSDALAIHGNLDTLRDYVRTTTAYSRQGQIGVTQPITAHWQVGADLRLTQVGAIAAVPSLGLAAQPATGNIWSRGLQAIGSNLYSQRDTHVFNLTHQQGPTFRGLLFMYNNLSGLGAAWTAEPSLQLYRQTDSSGLKLSRIKPGLRVSYRIEPAWTLESAADYEISRIRSTTGNDNTRRVFYYLGGRYDF